MSSIGEESMHESSSASASRMSGALMPARRLQRYIFWLNSLGLKRSLLVSSAADLQDGVALCEVITALLGEPPKQDASGPSNGVNALVDNLANLASQGWASSSSSSPVSSASSIFLRADEDTLCDVLGFLRGLAAELPERLPAQSTPGPSQGASHSCGSSSETPQPLTSITRDWPSPAAGSSSGVVMATPVSATSTMMSSAGAVQAREAPWALRSTSTSSAEPTPELGNGGESPGPLRRHIVNGAESTRFDMNALSGPGGGSIQQQETFLGAQTSSALTPEPRQQQQQEQQQQDRSEDREQQTRLHRHGWAERAPEVGVRSWTGEEEQLGRQGGPVEDLPLHLQPQGFSSSSIIPGGRSFPELPLQHQERHQQQQSPSPTAPTGASSTPPPAASVGASPVLRAARGAAAEASAASGDAPWFVEGVHPFRAASMHQQGSGGAGRELVRALEEDLRSTGGMLRATQELQGLVRQLDIDTDASVQIGSQATAGGAPPSPQTVSAPSPDRSSLFSSNLAPSPAWEVTRPGLQSGPGTGSSPSFAPSIAGGDEDGAGARADGGHVGDPSAESFRQFMDRISAQIDSGAIPAIGHEEAETTLEEPEGMGLEAWRLLALDRGEEATAPGRLGDGLGGGGTASEAPSSPRSQVSSCLDALTRLAEASAEDVEAVADSLGSTPTKAPPSPGPTDSVRAASAPRPRSRLGGGDDRQQPQPQQQRGRLIPARLRKVKARVDAGPQKSRPRAAALSTGAAEAAAFSPPQSPLSTEIAHEKAGAALAAAAERLSHATEAPSRRAAPPRAVQEQRWEASVNPQTSKKNAWETKKAFIDYAALKARRLSSPGVIVPRTRHGVGPTWFKKELGKEGQAWLEGLMGPQQGLPQGDQEPLRRPQSTSPYRPAGASRRKMSGKPEAIEAPEGCHKGHRSSEHQEGYASQFAAQMKQIRAASPQGGRTAGKAGRSSSTSPERVPRRKLPGGADAAGFQGTKSRGSRSRSPLSGPGGRQKQVVTTSDYSRAALAKAAAEDLGILGAPLPPKEEETTRMWLRALQLEVLPEEENQQLLNNPLRNGVLLCEVVGLLEGCEMPCMSQCPQDVVSCRRNLHHALQTLGLMPDNVDPRKSPPPREAESAGQYAALAWQVERIMQGNGGSVWSLLTYLRKKHPKAKLAAQCDLLVVDGSVVRASVGTGETVVRSSQGLLTPRDGPGSRSPQRQSWRRVRLPYDPASVCALEQSLTGFICSLGLVDASMVPQGLDAVMGRLSNGTLLCDIVAAVEGRPITGVFRKPRTERTRKANILRALDRLGSLREMSRRHLRDLDPLLRGERAALVGLLEDIHRLADKQPPRPEAQVEGEQPYLQGTYFGIYGPLSDHPALPHQPPASRSARASPARAPWRSPNASPSRGRPLPDSSGPKGAAREGPGAAEAPRERSIRPPQAGEEERGGSGGPRGRMVDGAPASPPPPRPPRAPSPSAAQRPESLKAREPLSEWEEGRPVRVWPPGGQLPEVRGPEKEREDEDAAAVLPGDEPSRNSARGNGGDVDLTFAEVRERREQLPKSGGAELGGHSAEEATTRWLEAVGIEVDPRWPLETAMKDGTLLCRIVGKLQHCDLKGVTQRPQSRASCLHNVTMALEVLRNRPSMPIEHLWKEQAIVDGEPGLAAALLKDIRKSYRGAWTAAKRSPLSGLITAGRNRPAGPREGCSGPGAKPEAAVQGLVISNRIGVPPTRK